jgi:hypothetical protein
MDAQGVDLAEAVPVPRFPQTRQRRRACQFGMRNSFVWPFSGGSPRFGRGT